MYRGSTPIITFPLPFKVKTLNNFYLVLYQGKDVEIIKTMQECEIDAIENTISIKLTSEETLSLEPARNLHMQIRAKLESGKEIVTQELTTYVYDTAYEGEL